jgi:hypothetical protein
MAVAKRPLAKTPKTATCPYKHLYTIPDGRPVLCDLDQPVVIPLVTQIIAADNFFRCMRLRRLILGVDWINVIID